MTNKELYRNFCNIETTIPIFSRDWWMDAVCGEENWDVILVEKGGQIVAALPYYFIKKRNGIIICQPMLTQTNGVWIKYPDYQKYERKLSYEMDILKEIINKLNKLNIISFNQNFYYTFTNWLPFYWNGFKQTTRYTYIIDNLTDLDNIYNNFKSSVRNKIKKANEIVKITYDRTLEEFYEINTMTFNRQNIRIPYNYQFLKNKDNILKQKNKRKIFFAEDSNGEIHSCLYLIWDDRSSYVHLVGENPHLRNSGAGSLLIWEAIKFTKEELKLNNFDFEGSMIESIESVRRAFGAKQIPYFNISKEYNRNNLLYTIAKDIYDYYPWLQKLYKKIRGR